jgi:acetyltransferase
VDSVIVIFIPPVVTSPANVAEAIREVASLFHERGKTLLASFMSSRGTPAELISQERERVPCFTFPESTAAVLAKACEYGKWLKRPKGMVLETEDIDKKTADHIVKSAFDRSLTHPFWLDAEAIDGLLKSYGIRMVQSITSRTAAEAKKAAREIGFPVALKLYSDTISHKTDVGGVMLDLHNVDEVEKAFEQISENIEKIGKKGEMQGVIVQKMIKGGVEVIAGITQDPSFGPLILFGTGGIYAELYKDVILRIHPLTDVDAREMIHSVKAFQLLQGWRGAEPSDIEAIEELLLRLSSIVEDLPQIAEMDLNPVKVLSGNNGYIVVDARIMLS